MYGTSCIYVRTCVPVLPCCPFLYCSFSYELSTLIDPPHLGASITGLIFQPVSQSTANKGSPACVTTATDGHFKAWRLTGQAQEDGPPPTWVCSSEAHHLEEPARGCSFSEDGSLLAVVYDYVSLVGR